MPIQPQNTHQYTKIPDAEDVTPVDSNIEKRAEKTEKSVKYTAFIAALVIGFIIISFMGYHYVSDIRENAAVYQTSSATFGDSNPTEQFITPDLVITFATFDSSDTCDTKCQFKKLSTPKMYVDDKITFQKIVGFGGAFTESTAHNFYRLPRDVQTKVLQYYFGENGIGLNMGRIHINSCDFSLKSYNFDNVPNDYELQFFDKEVTHDNIEIIPFLLEAMEVSKQPIKLVASPWSPPPWMKVPVDGKQTMTGSAQPNGLLDDPKIKTSWAHYLSKFVYAYQQKGIPIWAITPQNEPEFAAPWEACSYNASYEAEFINEYLGPILKSDHPDIKILGFDHNKDHLFNWTKILLANVSNPYVDGMAFHWYGGMDRVTDGTYGYNNINASYHYAKDKLFIATEGCSCPGVNYHDWIRAERLGHDIMYDLLNYAQGWIDWNLLVDAFGGPNHLNNYCDASIITLEDFQDVYIQPKYYYFGHFSKFLTPNAIRIESKIVGNFQYETMDPIIQANLELTMFPCEKSVRQMWAINQIAKTLYLVTPTEITDMNMSIQLCVSYGDIARPYLHLSDCHIDEKASDQEKKSIITN